MEIERRSRGEDDTLQLGRFLGAIVAAGDIVGLTGPLGAGKTCLVRGLAEGLGCDSRRVRSPSFTLLVAYGGGRLPLYHLDLFRMQPTAEDRLALREYLYGDGVCAVEWFDRLGEETGHLAIELSYSGTNERRIRLHGSGDRYERLLEAIAVEARWR